MGEWASGQASEGWVGARVGPGGALVEPAEHWRFNDSGRAARLPRAFLCPCRTRSLLPCRAGGGARVWGGAAGPAHRGGDAAAQPGAAAHGPRALPVQRHQPGAGGGLQWRPRWPAHCSWDDARILRALLRSPPAAPETPAAPAGCGAQGSEHNPPMLLPRARWRRLGPRRRCIRGARCWAACCSACRSTTSR